MFLQRISLLSTMVLLSVPGVWSQGLPAISGTVKDPTGSSVGNATVTLSRGAETKSTLTDAGGGFTFSSMQAGSYTIQVEAPGFAVFTKPVTVGAEAVVLDIGMALASQSGEVHVEAKVDPFNVVPNTPTGSLFGLDKTIEDTPRSISTADAETLARYSVKTVNDIVTVSPGTFTGSYFGISGSVFLRGDIGDNFFRGFRRVENRGNYQTPVAATDHIEVVKGPPSPAYGGGRIGGFLNFVPKTARSESAKWLERPIGKISVTYGSYDEKRASAEVGVPFKLGTHRSGVYAFYEAEDAHSFYKGVANRYQLGQIAFDMELSPKVRMEYGFQGFYNGGTQNIGWNRVTQDLVDNQMYLSGRPLVNLSRNGYNIGQGDITPNILTSFAFQQNMAGVLLGDPAVARLYALDPATVKLVKLPLDRIMIDDGDFTRSRTNTAFADLIYDFKPGFKIKNQLFLDHMSHQKYSSYGFGAGYRPWTLEDKLTMTAEWKPAPFITSRTIFGGGYRYVKVSAGEERNWYQVVDRRDLSVGATPNDRFAGPFNSNGDIFFQYFQQGNYGNTGLFVLSDWILWNNLTVVGGARLDRFTPKFTGRFNGEPMATSSAANNAGTYNASVSYRLPFHLQPYFTMATSRFLDLGQGNEIDQSQVANGTYIQKSNLYEAGVKTSRLPGRLYAAVSYFRQKRNSFNSQSRDIDYYQTTGVEAEARTFFGKRYTLTGAMTWQNPIQLNAPFLLGIPPNLVGLTPQQAYGGRFIGVANIFNLPTPYRVGGQPSWVISPFGTVNITRNAGFTLGTTWVSAVKTGYVSNVKLPSYALWRGSVFYQRSRYSLNLGINNMFNETYFQSQFLFWDVFIKPGALRTASLTLSYSF